LCRKLATAQQTRSHSFIPLYIPRLFTVTKRS